MLVEALEVSLPVLTSDLGGMTTIIQGAHTGIHSLSGNVVDLTRKVKQAATNPTMLTVIRIQARSEYKVKYSATRDYSMLFSIHEQAIAQSKRRR